MNNKFIIATTLLFPIVVTAKSLSEPSSAELNAALTAKTEEVQAALNDINMEVAYNKIDKLSCAPSKGKPGVICDMKIDMTVTTYKTRKDRVVVYETYRLIKNDSKWIIMEKLTQ